MGTAEGPGAALLLAWAALDLVQAPLVLAVFLAFRLSRRLGAPWRAVALTFAGYTAWIVVTARFVPFAPSGWTVLLFGMALDPRRETPAARVWALGSAVAIVVFWAVPVLVTWKVGRRGRRAVTTERRR
jgi:hypothetical protein